jgi:signal peptidase I
MAAEELALDADDFREEEQEAKGAARTDWWAEVRGIFWLVIAVLGFHSLVAKPFYIPSESMLPGLEVGDRLVVTKFPYGYSYVTPTFHWLPFMPGRLLGRMPERGDVVIVKPPESGADYIKRVIGLPGDTVGVRNGILFLNGRAVPRTALPDRLVPVDANTRCDDDPTHPGGSILYAGRRVRDASGRMVCRLTVFRETLPNGRTYDVADLGRNYKADNFPDIRVPRGKIFLMGDNRDNSADSRFSIAENGLGGPVPWENIGGRAEFITFSLDGSASWNPLTWPRSFRSGRAGLSLHPNKADQ